jgi:tetratricopeptide (TPR) repeat protein
MSYPGNPSLAEEVQQKILGTYRQTLDLAASGRRQEALLGCDFIHRLDPQFSPVEPLRERLEGQQGAIVVEDLRAEFERLLADAPGTAEESADVSDIETGEDLLTDDEIDAVLDGFDDGTPPEATEPDLVTPAEPATGKTESGLDAVELDTGPDTDLRESETGEATETSPSPEPSAELDQESADRVRELLAEGQAAFEQAEYQSAIDAWSRIFLIDIDHPEANRRIDLARKLKAEVERKLDELYHDGLAAIDRGDPGFAQEKFREVLALQPNHLAAQEQLERLVGGAGPEVEDQLLELDEAENEIETTVTSTEEQYDIESPSEELLEEIDEAPPPPRTRPAEPRRASRRPVLVIAALGILVALTAAWFLYSNWTRFFPNAAGQAVLSQQTTRADPIARAQGLHVEGNTAMAISQLRRLPPAHPKYAEAQALIAQWETVLEDETESGPSEEQLATRDELVVRAKRAFSRQEFLEAEELLNRASQAAPLDESGEALRAEVGERLEPLRSEIQIFRQGEWTYALRNLWRRHEEDPENLDVLRLMVNSYYNLAVRDLQRGDPDAAAENLREASSLAEDDSEVTRLLDFSETYTTRPPDLLYRIFVKYLPFRS